VILGLDDEYVQCDFEVCFGFDDGIYGVYERLMIDGMQNRKMRPSESALSPCTVKKCPSLRIDGK
jgi:hypothetical protein